MEFRAKMLLNAELATRDGIAVAVCDFVFNDRTWVVSRVLVQLNSGPDRRVKALDPEAVAPHAREPLPVRLDIDAADVRRAAEPGDISLSAMRTATSQLFRWGGHLGVGVPAPGWPPNQSDEQWAAGQGINIDEGLPRSIREILGYRFRDSRAEADAEISDVLLEPYPWRVAGFLTGGGGAEAQRVPVEMVNRVSWPNHSVFAERSR
jgi:hypothetical protein